MRDRNYTKRGTRYLEEVMRRRESNQAAHFERRMHAEVMRRVERGQTSREVRDALITYGALLAID